MILSAPVHPSWTGARTRAQPWRSAAANYRGLASDDGSPCTKRPSAGALPEEPIRHTPALFSRALLPPFFLWGLSPST